MIDISTHSLRFPGVLVPKKTKDLDTPFRKGEEVLTVRDIRGAGQGKVGNVRLVNGLSDYNGGTPWVRYWVKFDDGSLLGHVSHSDLVRPQQLNAWQTREDERVEAAKAAESAIETDAAAPAADAGDAGGGVASLIPAALLERSRAAKARLLGG